MRAARVVLAACAILTAAPAAASVVGCEKFRRDMAHASGDLKADFTRPLVVARGAPTGVEQFDLVSASRIDGVLKCRGDAFDSLQLTIHLPADAALTARFLHAQEAALVAGLGWSHARARTKAQEMAHEAEDYLRGSIERGDHEIAGKLEEHLPGGVDLGAIHTKTERTFILLNVD